MNLVKEQESLFKSDYIKLNWSNLNFESKLRGHHSCVNTVHFSHGEADLLISGGDDKRVLLWNIFGPLHLCRPLKAFYGHQNNIFRAIFDSTNHHIFSCALDGLIMYYDVEHYVHDPHNHHQPGRDTLKGHEGSIFHISLNPYNDHLLLSCSDDGSIRYWDTRLSDKTVWAYIRSKEQSAVTFHPNMENIFAAAGGDQGLELFDLRKIDIAQPNKKASVIQYTTQLQRQKQKAKPSISSITFNRMGNLMLTATQGYLPTLYSPFREDPICTFYDAKYKNICTVKSFCFGGKEDEFIACGSDDYKVYIWKVPNEYIDDWDPFNKTLNVEKYNIYKDTYYVNPHTRKKVYNQVVQPPVKILSGYKSNPNNTVFHPHFPLLLSSGVEKMIHVHSQFSLGPQTGLSAEEPRTSTSFVRRTLYEIRRDDENAGPLFFSVVFMMPREQEEENEEEDEGVFRFFDLLNHQYEDIFRSSEGSSDSMNEEENEDYVHTDISTE